MAALDNVTRVGGIAEAQPINDELAEILTSCREHLKFNANSIHDASLLLFAEGHHLEETNLIQARIVNYYASKGPVIILHEGLESGELLVDEEVNKYKTGAFQKRHYNPQYEKNISIVGWDVADKVWDEVGNPAHQKMAYMDAIAKCQLVISEAKRQIEELAPGMAIFDAEVLDPRLIELDAATLEKIAALVHEVATCKNAEVKATEGLVECIQNPLKPQKVDEIFPSRTASMIKTLQDLPEIKRKLGLEDAMVILIAGRDHIIASRETEGKPGYDLSPLYTELEKHRCISLVPHIAWPN